MSEPTAAELVEKVANALGYEVQNHPDTGVTDVTTVEAKPDDDTKPREDAAPQLQAWKGPLVVENAPTGDRRRIMPGAITARELPLTMMLQRETPQGGLGGNPHAGARAAGHIKLIWPGDDGIQWGAGVFDTGADGQEAARMRSEDTLRGLSVDLCSSEAEIGCLQMGADGECAKEELQITSGEIMGVTITPFPAIPEAQFELIDSTEFASLSAQYGQAFAANEPDADDVGSTVAKRKMMQPGGGKIDKSKSVPSGSDTNPATGTPDAAMRGPMTADGGPLLPPEDWFANPELAHPTPFTITDDGRVYGHAAQWGVCHIGVQGTCVTAPHSPSGYSHFTVGAVRASCDCDDPSGQAEIPTGPITLGTDHADGRLTPAEATMHYANTGMAVADVSAGEDEHGIWVAGALRPGLADEKIRELRSAALSGDWRRIGGNLELVGVLAVNVPGFGVGRTKFHTAGQDQTALVAAGVIVGEKLTPTDALEMQARELAALRREISEIHKAVAVPVLIDQQVARLKVNEWVHVEDQRPTDSPPPTPPPVDLAAELIHLTIEEGAQLRNFDTAQRKAAAKSGAAMPDGSFPINNCGDWMNARRAIGRAPAARRPAVQAHIDKRGKALGCGSGDSGS